ncbi:hypothetical protein E2C01_057624 [Portunus trituberculatus]|uniref:Uncharacterized protein n=1 Tax=Portunus trituberculatus TaxID=210409 RepID=A0A5B7H101_PORTR|nr:hypothetical protein [Portunus trituberculatus]
MSVWLGRDVMFSCYSKKKRKKKKNWTSLEGNEDENKRDEGNVSAQKMTPGRQAPRRDDLKEGVDSAQQHHQRECPEMSSARTVIFPVEGAKDGVGKIGTLAHDTGNES